MTRIKPRRSSLQEIDSSHMIVRIGPLPSTGVQGLFSCSSCPTKESTMPDDVVVEEEPPAGEPVDDISPKQHEWLNRKGAILSLMKGLSEKQVAEIMDERGSK